MIFAPAPLAFERDGRDWPNRDASAFVTTRGARWHVQRMGEGPQCLLIHGTGASTHSFAALIPLLAARFEVIAPDLVGHGFTRTERSPDLSLPGMARAVAGLLKALDFRPKVVVGHSAGAAILARMCLDGAIAPALLVSLNGAFLPFEGAARYLFPSIAKLLFVNPLAPRLFAWAADRKAVENLIRGTGSKLDARGLDLYARLLGNAAHVGGALGMMANWDLATMRRDLPKLKPKVVLIVGDNDKAVSPGDAAALAREIPGAAVETVTGTGHLSHEEKPEAAADLIFGEAERLGVIGVAQSAPRRRKKSP